MNDAQSQHASRYQVMPCPDQRRREALLHLAAVHDATQQADLQHALTTASSDDWRGLWVAMTDEHLCAAAWVQPLSNQTAQLWLPRQIDAALPLLSALREWVSREPIALCHVVLPSPWDAWETTLVRSGMRAMATLEHRVWPGRSPIAPPPSLSLCPFTTHTRAAQQALLARVGEDSLDCPALRDALPVTTLLAGFQAQAGASNARYWFGLTCQQQTVGVLLLDAADAHWSLQLMGLAPEWRGQGLGKAIIGHAQTLAAQAGAQSLSLTVDAQNTPARRVYEQTGFELRGRERLLGWY